MTQIKITKTPIYISLLWSYLLYFIPTIVIALKLKNSRYEYDDDQIIVEKGVFKKQQDAINLSFVLDVQGSSNIFKYGKVILKTRHKIITMDYVKDPLEVARVLRDIVLNYDKNKSTMKFV